LDSNFVSPAPTRGSPEIDLYQMLGGAETCQKLVVAFYAHVEHDPVLRPLYPPTLDGCPIKALTAYLVQFLGGPPDYAQRRWSLSLREAHFRFKIGQKEREAWLKAMFQAVDDLNIREPARSALRWWFESASAYFINQPHAKASEPPPFPDSSIDDENSSATARVHGDIVQRWQAQWTLEEMVAAVRRQNAAAVLTGLASPGIQACFMRDHAAFLSFLAIVSSSTQPALLDYLRQVLASDPGLVHERYTYGRTLLHGVAGQGNLSFVELLLRLGADPNASDGFGHTPLYVVANSSDSARGANVVRVLAEAGADVNAQDKLKHCTALHMAARRGTVPVAEALLDCGADLEARDKLGDTPLRRAVNCGKAEMVAFLLSRGADVHSRGKNGLTPRQVARSAVMKKLLERY